jgi:peptidoglycan/LPS O-acetylase OafA/YrhL
MVDQAGASASARAVAPSSRIGSLDMLRGFAIMWVVLFHLWGDVKIGAHLPRYYETRLFDRVTGGEFNGVFTLSIDAFCRLGYLGVPLFMMFSGLSLYLSASRPGPGLSVLTFYRKRLGKVLVPYWVGFGVIWLGACLVAALQVYWQGGSFMFQYHHGVTVAGFDVIDLTWEKALLHMALVPRLFSDVWLNTPPGALWFVALIVQYYLLFPLLRPLLDRVGPLPFLAGALTIELATRAVIIAMYGGLFAPTAFHVTTVWAPARITEFAIGMAAGYVMVHRPRLLRVYMTAPGDIAGIVALGLLALVVGTTTEWDSRYVPIINNALVIFGLSAISLVLIVKAPGLLESNPLGRLLAWVGVMSYAMLIVNEPMRLLQSAIRGNVSNEWWWAFLIVVYVPVGALLAWPLAKILGLLPPPRAATREAARPTQALTPVPSETAV